MFLTELLKQRGCSVKKWAEEKKLIVLEAPTGSGKTYFACDFLQKICLENNTTLALIVNRKILKLQLEEKNKRFMLENYIDTSPLRIFTYQSLEQDNEKAEKTIKYLEECEYVIADEGHYYCSDPLFNPSAEKSLEYLVKLIGKVCIIFLTATPKNLIPILDTKLEVLNEQCMQAWEKDCENKQEERHKHIVRDYLPLIYAPVYEDDIDNSDSNNCEDDECSSSNTLPYPLTVYVEAEELYAEEESEEDKSYYEPEPQPTPYNYQLIEENNPDYGYVTLTFYESVEELLKLIVDSPRTKKWLVFVNTKKKASN